METLPIAAAGSAPGRLDLLGLGECMVELHADEPLGVARSLQRDFGGDVLNALVAASRLGARTGFVTRVGDDPFGAALLAGWRAEGIDTSQAQLVAGDNGVYFISVDARGEREFSYRRSGSAAAAMDASLVDEAAIAGARWLLVSGITQALSAGAQAATREAVRLARRHGTQVAYDPNYRPRLWQSRGGLAAARQAFAEIAGEVDWLLPSQPADAELLGGDVDRADACTVLRAFARLSPRVALKCGEAGAWLAFDGWFFDVPVEAVVRPVDSTGAGDAWNGAFLHHLMRDLPPAAAALAAHGVAARTLLHRGAIAPREEGER